MESVPAPLTGKIALVTGASRGIGACIAEVFASQGCTHIAITYKSNRAKAEETLARIANINSNIRTCAFPADVGEEECGRYAVEKVDVHEFPAIEHMTKDKWDRVITAEAWTPFLLARESARVMPPGGRIIMLSSINSKLASGDPVVSYAAGKAAMEAVCRNMAAKYGVQNGITVNSISVGPTETDSLRTSFETVGPALKGFAEELSLLKRLGNVQEVANIVAFVASPQASWLVGNQIPANGGALAILQG